MSDLEILRRQVAVGGVARNTSGVLSGNVVEARRKDTDALVGECRSRSDGSFYFLDLPDSEYTISALSVGKAASKDAVVKRDAKGTLRMVFLDLQIAD
jgi:hypothetical protein